MYLLLIPASACKNVFIIYMYIRTDSGYLVKSRTQFSLVLNKDIMGTLSDSEYFVFLDVIVYLCL